MQMFLYSLTKPTNCTSNKQAHHVKRFLSLRVLLELPLLSLWVGITNSCVDIIFVQVFTIWNDSENKKMFAKMKGIGIHLCRDRSSRVWTDDATCGSTSRQLHRPHCKESWQRIWQFVWKVVKKFNDGLEKMFFLLKVRWVRFEFSLCGFEIQMLSPGRDIEKA